MKRLAVVFILVISTLVLAQDAAKPAQTTADNGVTDELRQLRQAIEAQQKQIQQQQQEIDALKTQLVQTGAPAEGTPRVVDAALRTAPAGTTNASLNTATVGTTNAAQVSEVNDEEKSPLSWRIGKMDFTPGGFLDFTTVFRSTNTGNTLGTGFGTNPFSNTIAGHMTEMRMSSQNSRLSLKAHGKMGDNDITGYVEVDFLGNDPANVFVTSNSHTDRLRLYWLDFKRNRWEFLAGQSWSWMTPNRVGVSPDPQDIFFTLNSDTNYQAGLTWTRAAQFRVVFHPNEHWAMGLSLENPQQYVSAGEVIYPFAWNAQLGGQFDTGAIPGAPNAHPDLIPKVAYDTTFGDNKHLHFEVAGLVTTKKIAFLPIGPPGPVPCCIPTTASTGGAVEFASNVDLAKKLRFVMSGFYGAGGGRYIGGLGPDAVVKPVPEPFGYNVAVKLVNSGSGIVGFELPWSEKTTVAAYYSGAYFDHVAFPDPTNPVVLGIPIACEPGQPLQTKPCIGFGGTNSPNSANRTVQEATFDWVQTLWSNKNYGKLQMIGQFGYLTRSPWFVAAGAPKNAHLFLGYVDLRYVLP